MKKITSFTNVNPISAEWPFGDVKDDDGSNNGTEVERESMSDVWQFLAKMAYEANLLDPTFVVNDVIDNEYDGWQVYEAFRILTRPYKVYSAIINQTGTADPTVIIAENHIGNIVWTRDSTGVYFGTLVGAFATTASNPTGALCFLTQGSFAFPPGAFLTIARHNDDVVKIYVYDNAGAAIDGVMRNSSLEIRVYD